MATFYAQVRDSATGLMSLKPVTAAAVTAAAVTTAAADFDRANARVEARADVPGLYRPDGTPIRRVNPERLEEEGLVHRYTYDNLASWYPVPALHGPFRIIDCKTPGVPDLDRRDLEEGLSLILGRREMKRALTCLILPPELVVGWLRKDAPPFLKANCPEQGVLLVGGGSGQVAAENWVPTFMTNGQFGGFTTSREALRQIVDWREDIDVIRGKRTRYPVLNPPHLLFFGEDEFPTAEPDDRMGFRQPTE